MANTANARTVLATMMAAFLLAWLIVFLLGVKVRSQQRDCYHALIRVKWWHGARAVILKSETYNFHRLDLTRQAGFIVTVYDEDGLRLAATQPCSTPAEAFAEARKIVDGKVEGPKNNC